MSLSGCRPPRLRRQPSGTPTVASRAPPIATCERRIAYQTYDELPGIERVIAKVRLFHPLSQIVYYVVAVIDYSGQLVLSGSRVNGHGSSFGDSSLQELATFRSALPIGRDLHFEPRRLVEIIDETRAREAAGRGRR